MSRTTHLPQTCVWMNCPFISYCKHYSLTADRSPGCETQKKILEAAASLNRKKGK